MRPHCIHRTVSHLSRDYKNHKGRADKSRAHYESQYLMQKSLDLGVFPRFGSMVAFSPTH